MSAAEILPADTPPDRLTDPDGFYEALIRAHAGLDETSSHALNARLVLLMANEIGDVARLKALLAIGRAHGV